MIRRDDCSRPPPFLSFDVQLKMLLDKMDNTKEKDWPSEKAASLRAMRVSLPGYMPPGTFVM